MRVSRASPSPHCQSTGQILCFHGDVEGRKRPAFVEKVNSVFPLLRVGGWTGFIKTPGRSRAHRWAPSVTSAGQEIQPTTNVTRAHASSSNKTWCSEKNTSAHAVWPNHCSEQDDMFTLTLVERTQHSQVRIVMLITADGLLLCLLPPTCYKSLPMSLWSISPGGSLQRLIDDKQWCSAPAPLGRGSSMVEEAHLLKSGITII